MRQLAAELAEHGARSGRWRTSSPVVRRGLADGTLHRHADGEIVPSFGDDLPYVARFADF